MQCLMFSFPVLLLVKNPCLEEAAQTDDLIFNELSLMFTDL